MSNSSTSSSVRPAWDRALCRVDSEEEPLLKAIRLPARSSMDSMPLSAVTTILSLVWTELGAKTRARPWMHRVWAPLPI